MTCREFENIYWINYILLEKEFKNTLKYVSLTKDNFATYSNEYLKLILEIGSELDVVLKSFCKYKDNSFKDETMDKYKDFINKNCQSIISESVVLRNTLEMLKPWDEISIYWKAYNKIKHDRNGINTIGNETKESYKFANLKNTLYLLAALYEILLNYYMLLAKSENNSLLIPLPGSRLFILSGENWNEVNFVYDHAFALVGNKLCMKSSNFDY